MAAASGGPWGPLASSWAPWWTKASWPSGAAAAAAAAAAVAAVAAVAAATAAAAMWGASESAWWDLRLLCEGEGVELSYSPMMHSRLFAEDPKYRLLQWQLQKTPKTNTREGRRLRRQRRRSNSSSSRRDSSRSSSSSSSRESSTEAWWRGGEDACKETTSAYDTDVPLIAQFCGHTAEHMVAAGRLVEETVSAVDINLGCPQGIARRGYYGAYLLEEPELIVSMVSAMHQHLRVPVTCKMRKVAKIFGRVLLSVAAASDARLQSSAADAAAAPAAAAAATAEQQLDRTCQDTLLLAYALEAAGAAALTLHGRTRHEKGADTGTADWGLVRRLAEIGQPRRSAASSKGKPLGSSSILLGDRADGVMAAEGLLDDPSLFSGAASLLQQQVLQQLQPTLQPLAVRLGVLSSVSSPSSSSSSSSSVADGLSPLKRVELMQRYMEICRIYPPPHSGCSKAHLFRCLHPILAVNTQWRDALHQSSSMEDLWSLMDSIVQHFSNENNSSSSSSSETWYRRHRKEGGEGAAQEAGDTSEAETVDPCSLAAEGFEGLFGSGCS
ncbi:hypothetical protein Emed_002890 [Eimeria media]